MLDLCTPEFLLAKARLQAQLLFWILMILRRVYRDSNGGALLFVYLIYADRSFPLTESKFIIYFLDT